MRYQRLCPFFILDKKIHKDEEIKEDVNHNIEQGEWNGDWRNTSGIMCDCRIPQVKVKVL